MDLAVLIISALTLAFAGLAAWFALRTDRRERERSDVQWTVRPSEQDRGTFTLLNVGEDPAYQVSVRAWDEREMAEATATRVATDEGITFVLPERKRRGPTPADLPPEIPRPPTPKVDDDAVLPAALRARIESMRDEEAHRHAIRQGIAERMQAQQVTVRIRWRTKLGRWSEVDRSTG